MGVNAMNFRSGLQLYLAIVICLFCSISQAENKFEGVVVAHQKMTLLLHYSTQDVENSETVLAAARHYYADKKDALSVLYRLYDNEEGEAGQVSSVSADFVDYIAGNGALRDGDKLAFLDFGEDLLVFEQERGLNESQLEGLQSAVDEIDDVYSVYREEYSSLTGLLGTDGQREQWNDYIAYLARKYNQQKLVSAFAKANKDDLKVNDRSAVEPSNVMSVLRGNEFKQKTVVLTFDDGPHIRRTNQILDELRAHGMTAHFFACGERLGKITDDNHPIVSSRAAAIGNRIINEGHALGNHSFSHPQLTKLEISEVSEQLSDTNALISEITGENNSYFRPPYGSHNESIDELVNALGMTTVMWNVDSRDWADPVPESIAQRVIASVKRNNGGIILLHDIHRQTVEAVPEILRKLNEMGYRTVGLVR
jgi:peptidoglycan/xylan/chitin deacetylase (PgdA/CDA1 family)